MPVMSCNGDVENLPRLERRLEAHLRELLGAADRVGFSEHASLRADLVLEMLAQRRFAFLPQPPRPFSDEAARHLWHSCGRRAFTWREREHVQMREPAFVDEIE